MHLHRHDRYSLYKLLHDLIEALLKAKNVRLQWNWEGWREGRIVGNKTENKAIRLILSDCAWKQRTMCKRFVQ